MTEPQELYSFYSFIALNSAIMAAFDEQLFSEKS